MTERDPQTIMLRGNTCLVERLPAPNTSKGGIILVDHPGRPRRSKKGVLVGLGTDAPRELDWHALGKTVDVHGHARPQASWAYQGKHYDVYHGEDLLAVEW